MSEEAPVRLCCGTRHYGAACPDGKVMCCLCFHRFSQDELYRDESGRSVNVCIKCYEDETSDERV